MANTTSIAGKKDNGVSIHARRFIAYLVLILVSFLCLFWFYVLFINATRSHSELSQGFTAIPSTHAIENWVNLKNGTRTLKIPFLDMNDAGISQEIVDDNKLLLTSGVWGVADLMYAPP